MVNDGTKLRHINYTHLRRKRKGECRWCGGTVKPPRRTWCSQTCVENYRIRAEPSYASHMVGERDGGVCRACGMDTGKLERVLRSISDKAPRAWDWTEGEKEARYAVIWALRQIGIGRVSWPRRLWERDHIVAVAEGGGSCGLDNYQTLCIPCHRAKTAEMRKRLAATEVG